MSAAANPLPDLRTWAALQPEKTALQTDAGTWRYAELNDAADRLAQVFRALGLERGQHVAGLLPNGPMPFVMAWAAYRAGLYFTPLPTTLTAAELAYLVDNSEARCVLLHARHAALLPALTAAAPGVHWFSVGGRIEGVAAVEDRMAQAPAGPIADETPGTLMFYTSGTTGRPKGVWRPLLPAGHRGPPPFASDLLSIFDLGREARYLSTAPLYHAAPLRFGLALTAAGGTVSVMDRFDAATALRRVADEGITHSQWVPTMFQRLLALPEEQRRAFHAPAHRYALHAAAPCPVPLKQAMIDWWGPILQEYYSGSESVGLTAIDSHEWLKKPGSVGRAKKGVMHILGDDDVELPANQVGRIYFSGASRFEYFNEPEKTAARTSRQGFQTFGDVGRVDEDGYLFLTDRVDDMIISGGVNVYPQEIEAAIERLPGVAEVAVVGLPHPDFGESPVAFVVPAPQAAHDPAALVQAVRAHCAAHLGRIKQPSDVRVLAELPRSATGKLLRRLLREQA